ncbi:hypothetical protein [Actinomadura sp. WMMB 499]|uniref:hypothetical protein n=1 Tax=Actinomadura sp. WMMB 499 TaxID=1219491 RepID=UPI0012466834|nr:hypothetical protein [Actinomadura sp. WMMB 499]QFG22801.1 hypothetical protein F7P10_18435 [Actinomadura sp. WMMB 499]
MLHAADSSFPAWLDRDPDLVQADLAWRFPGVPAWFGEWTGAWWAVVGDRLLEAASPEILVEMIRTALAANRPSPPPAPPARPVPPRPAPVPRPRPAPRPVRRSASRARSAPRPRPVPRPRTPDGDIAARRLSGFFGRLRGWFAAPLAR